MQVCVAGRASTCKDTAWRLRLWGWRRSLSVRPPLAGPAWSVGPATPARRRADADVGAAVPGVAASVVDEVQDGPDALEEGAVPLEEDAVVPQAEGVQQGALDASRLDADAHLASHGQLDASGELAVWKGGEADLAHRDSSLQSCPFLVC